MRTGASTADARKSPSIEAGNTLEKTIAGCSMERDWKKRSAADFVAPYSARVGAGIRDATEETKSMEGLVDVRSSKGICIRVQTMEMDRTTTGGLIRTNAAAESKTPKKFPCRERSATS
jgi:hypothetical protein